VDRACLGWRIRAPGLRGSRWRALFDPSEGSGLLVAGHDPPLSHSLWGIRFHHRYFGLFAGGAKSMDVLRHPRVGSAGFLRCFPAEELSD